MAEVLNRQGRPNDKITPEIYNLLLELAEDIRFGSVTLIFQDGKIVQIEKNEKVRVV